MLCITLGKILSSLEVMEYLIFLSNLYVLDDSSFVKSFSGSTCFVSSLGKILSSLEGDGVRDFSFKSLGLWMLTLLSKVFQVRHALYNHLADLVIFRRFDMLCVITWQDLVILEGDGVRDFSFKSLGLDGSSFVKSFRFDMLCASLGKILSSLEGDGVRDFSFKSLGLDGSSFVKSFSGLDDSSFVKSFSGSTCLCHHLAIILSSLEGDGVRDSSFKSLGLSSNKTMVLPSLARQIETFQHAL
ncbi:hypothetical protein PVAND_010423 [Polypedilum vanderplanki]|uniref:Uncharacterized protein n=1 Tax=Polypedilum vanderplanki TaxID=319348 RepID=A0A9J6CFV8_POLVA|nr:hypothetical protein PVAND_010423 [Polypedilum vanderplanki]